MAKYIEIEAALQSACKGCNIEFDDQPCEPCDCYIREKLLAVPTIDAVPVVRCRECKHRETVDCPMCHEEYHFDEDDGGDYSLWTRVVDPNGFCSCGERKEGTDNS